jgi:hypothetical protein
MNVLEWNCFDLDSKVKVKLDCQAEDCEFPRMIGCYRVFPGVRSVGFDGCSLFDLEFGHGDAMGVAYHHTVKSSLSRWDE